jgi:hypothetical protein
MRFSTLAAVGVIAASTAALAQVASTPSEQKVPAGQTAQGNDIAAPDNGVAPDGTAVTTTDDAAVNTTPVANDLTPAAPPAKAPRRPR